MFNIAIIGAGNIATMHTTAYQKMKDVRIKTIVDVDVERAKIMAENVDCKATANIDEVLHDPEIEAVDICLPNFLHLETVMKAAEAGKHIICEKPAALTVEDAEKMFDICRKNNVVLYIAQVCRFMTAYQEIHHVLEEKDVGDPKLVRLSRSVHYPMLVGQEWYKDESKSGGLFLDFVIHDLDFIVWNFGKPEIISSQLISEEKLKGIIINLKVDGGPMITVNGVWTSIDQGGLHQRVEIDGTNGFVHYDNRNELPFVFKNTSGKSRMLSKETLCNDPFYRELRHFINCFRGTEQPLITDKEVIQTLETAIEAREIAREKGLNE
ncbi:dehydrogenase [Thalassobacillus devorans]|uniref:Dehydrogenase n=1 Tax=Thalassobacillus devorans TaxID=279813 RepID=A0ABQ1NSC6_9BACI|nr:Gfo/Idh/MocA family oxidoreductase [Thalassobacillus devorans]NIK28715.1 putative dehydrogenase [Thalassobacillus devorans]GGC84107.1 dehydrogenase [Thalassobacillus devorans]